MCQIVPVSVLVIQEMLLSHQCNQWESELFVVAVPVFVEIEHLLQLGIPV